MPTKDKNFMKLQELTPNENNPREITDEKLAMLGESLDEFGDLSMICFNIRSQRLFGGHQRLKKLPPDTEIVVTETYQVPTRTGTVWEGYAVVNGERFNVRAVDWDPDKEAAAMVAANKHGGGWSLPKLSEILKGLSDKNYNMNLTGFSNEELSKMIAGVTKCEPGCDEDEVPSITVDPKTRPGDIYQLGSHRLMCGDSTLLDSVEKLMNGQKADMVFTDPPYNVNYEGSDGQKIKNDDMSEEQFREFCLAFYTNYFIAMKEGASIYVFHSDIMGDHFRSCFKTAGFKLASTLIWNKSSLIMGRSDYHWKHEPCLYGWKPGASHRWFADRKQTTVFDHDKGSGEDNKMHPTCKPVSLVEYFMANSSLRDDLILDLFGGSGSTLIAAQKNGRKCFTMELDPKYCDVIVKRWEKYSGQKAELIAEGSLIQ